MTMTAPETPKLALPDDSIRATFEEIHAASMAGQTARLEGRGPGVDAIVEALIGEDWHVTAHRTRDLLDAYRRGWRSAAPARPAAPKHRAEIPAPVIEATEETEETGRNLMPIVVLLALASVPTAAVIGAVSYLA